MHQVPKVLLKSAFFHGNPETKLQNGAERIIVLLFYVWIDYFHYACENLADISKTQNLTIPAQISRPKLKTFS